MREISRCSHRWMAESCSFMKTCSKHHGVALYARKHGNWTIQFHKIPRAGIVLYKCNFSEVLQLRFYLNCISFLARLLLINAVSLDGKSVNRFTTGGLVRNTSVLNRASLGIKIGNKPSSQKAVGVPKQFQI